jgi:hypothetical protein
MRPPDDLGAAEAADAARDGLALVEAVHRGDGEAVGVVCDHGELRLMAVFLARVVDDLVEDLALWRDEGLAEVVARYRREWET